jgi:hypothetical protein
LSAIGWTITKAAQCPPPSPPAKTTKRRAGHFYNIKNTSDKVENKRKTNLYIFCSQGKHFRSHPVVRFHGNFTKQKKITSSGHNKLRRPQPPASPPSTTRIMQRNRGFFVLPSHCSTFRDYMQSFQDFQQQVGGIGEGEGEHMDYTYEPVQENEEEAVGPRRSLESSKPR